MELAIDRVATRVKEGGHNIPEDVIVRRYKGGIRNLFKIYLPIVDELLIFDNTQNVPKIVAGKKQNEDLDIFDNIMFTKLKENYEN